LCLFFLTHFSKSLLYVFVFCLEGELPYTVRDSEHTNHPRESKSYLLKGANYPARYRFLVSARAASCRRFTVQRVKSISHGARLRPITITKQQVARDVSVAVHACASAQLKIAPRKISAVPHIRKTRRTRWVHT